MLAHQTEALGVVDQRGEVDQVRWGHGGKRSFGAGELPPRFYHAGTFPARPPPLPLSTPDPEKSHRLKQFRALATRYDKTAVSYLAGAHLAAIRVWLRYAHTP
jgi:transposase